MTIDVDILCFSHLRWDFVYQRPQHLMARCARETRVFYIEEPMFDADAAWLEVSARPEGVTLVIPHLPVHLGPEIGDEAHMAYAPLLDDLMKREGIRRPLLWYYNPLALGVGHRLHASAVVYDCMDELSAFAGASPLLRSREAELLREADLVFAAGSSLYEAKRSQHPRVSLFPSSVDAAHFGRAREARQDPADVAAIPHPRIGFYGVLDERLDRDLLAAVADLRPDWQWVMIGPVLKIEESDLPRRANIHYRGAKSYEELPAYLAGWDVAMLPFALNDATRYISPTKTPEYLAGGVPVVSTPIRDVVQPYEKLGLVRIAKSPEAFVAAVDAALHDDRAALRKRADAFLRERSWDRTWERMRAEIEHVLGPRLSEPVGDDLVREMVPVVGRARRTYDVVVVGAGFAGSVLAERMARGLDLRVLVIDRRSHVGGNAYDHPDASGVVVHRYGPHIFHTNSARVFDYLSQFTAWRPYEHRVKALVDGKLLPMPINLDTVNGLYGLSLSSQELETYFASVAEPRATVRTSEDAVVSKVGRDLYEKFFRGYTRKQWGLDPSQLDAGVAARVPARTSRDDRYFTDSYQVMPLDGYTRMFEAMLDHPNISVMVETDFGAVRDGLSYRDLVFTGPVDEYFEYRYGKLPYRSLDFRFETHDVPVYQPAAVINYPNEHEYTRVTEFKYLTGQEHSVTTLVYEYPQAEGDPYYPIPRPENAERYRHYKALADATPHVHFVGRLATYKYYNMDQVVAQALAVYDRVAKETGVQNGSDRREEPAATPSSRHVPPTDRTDRGCFHSTHRTPR
jgi:UDP-galactopyranose mutase